VWQIPRLQRIATALAGGSPLPLRHAQDRLVEAVDRLRQSIVIAVADAADRRFDACLSEVLRISDGDILAAAVAVVDEAATVDRASLMDSLLQCSPLRDTLVVGGWAIGSTLQIGSTP